MSNLVNIRSWHDALVSGNYPQTQGTLVRDGAFCCLGVASHLAMLDGCPITEVDTDDDRGFRWDSKHGTLLESDVLPLPVREWLGLDAGDCDPMLVTGWTGDGDPEMATASELNDNNGSSFAEIAACIKLTWPQAFASTEQSQGPEKDGT